MDSTEQAEGEKKVKRVLIDPLMRRGLMRPAGMKVEAFDAMVAELCAKLAYMSELNLAALEEDAASMASGKLRDRFPVGQRILERAVTIESPGDDASPLIRAVFAHQLGQDAIREGWAPELLADLRQNRRWPGAWGAKSARERADDALRQMRSLDTRLQRGETLTASEDRWRAARLAAIDKCQRIADLGRSEGGATC